MTESTRANRLVLALVLVVAASTGAIVFTYGTLSHTWDEATHVIAGLEWLQDGRYTIQTENPPLSRVPLAIIPYLSGARMPPQAERVVGQTFIVDTVFYRSRDYIRNVTEARVATLIFFWACVALTWSLAGGRSDPWVAFLAAAGVATLPAVVAHSGLATTDIPFVASFLLALCALRHLLANPSAKAASLAGAALGLAIATKFSTLVFLPPAVVAIVFMHYWPDRASALSALRRGHLWQLFMLIAATALIVTWAAYRFNVGRLSELPTRFGPYGTMPTTGWPAMIRDWRIPGHEFLHGLLFLKTHTVAGHRSTLFDTFSQRGFLFYYPVVLATKTPIPFLLFWCAGLVGLFRVKRAHQWRWHAGLALAAFGVLAVAMTSPINLGVRHVLVIYPLVVISSAFGIVSMAERSTHPTRVLAAAGGALALQMVLLGISVPNQLTYFNAFAGAEPAYVSSDSDFDWGQHGLALQQYFASHQVPELYVLLNGTTKACAMGLPPLKVLPTHAVSGWIAVSERSFRLNQGVIRENPCELPGDPGKTFTAPPGWLDWLKRYQPVATIGKTVRLYHVTDIP